MKLRSDSDWRTWRGRPLDGWAYAAVLSLLVAAGVYRPRSGAEVPSDDEIVRMVGDNAALLLAMLRDERP